MNLKYERFSFVMNRIKRLYRSVFLKYVYILFIAFQSLLILTPISSARGQVVSDHQIAFAHRVNDWDEIAVALGHGVNGIEIDICWGGGALRSDDWYVSHNDADVCANASAEHLDEWLGRLKNTLNNNSTYKKQFVALWIDIKDLSDYDKLDKAVKTVHQANLPFNTKVIYDLTGYGEYTEKAFVKIRPLLTRFEGVSICAGKSCGQDDKLIDKIFTLYKDYFFTRGGFNHGHSINIDETFLEKANTIKNDPSPYRFKFVHTWTNKRDDSMADYINPNNSYNTDGQIIGAISRQYGDGLKWVVNNFKLALALYPDEKYAKPSDLILGDEIKFGSFMSDTNTQKCMDVLGVQAVNGAKVVIHSCHGGANQSWMYEAETNLMRSYIDPFKCVEARLQSTEYKLQMNTCDDKSTDQQWLRLSDGSIRLKNNPQMCIEASSTTNGTPLELGLCNEISGQKWFHEPDFKALQSKHGRRKCLSVSYTSFKDGQNTQLWDCDSRNNKKWFMDNEGLIRNLKDAHKCLVPEGDSFARGTTTEIMECDTTNPAHQWVRTTQGEIKPAQVSNMCLDISGWQTSNGAKVHLWNCHNGNNQLWEEVL